MSEEILNKLLKEYSETQDKLLDECKALDEQITKLQAARSLIVKPYEKLLNEIKTNIQVMMFDRKSSFTSEYGKITYYSAGVRRTWNLDSLDLICNGNPLVKQFIWPFRNEEPFDARITIKV